MIYRNGFRFFIPSCWHSSFIRCPSDGEGGTTHQTTWSFLSGPENTLTILCSVFQVSGVHRQGTVLHTPPLQPPPGRQSQVGSGDMCVPVPGREDRGRGLQSRSDPDGRQEQPQQGISHVYGKLAHCRLMRRDIVFAARSHKDKYILNKCALSVCKRRQLTPVYFFHSSVPNRGEGR